MINIDGEDIDLLKKDWGVLIILDACRYDIFSEVYRPILKKKGVLKKAITHCSGTKEWMVGNIYNKDCGDIIYVDPIVMFDNFVPKHNFFKVEMVWKKYWDYDYGTINPKDMTDVAIELIKKNPEKRFIIHYHQPHPPYLLTEYLGLEDVITPEKIIKAVNENINPHNTFSHFFQGNLKRFLGHERAWKILINLNMKIMYY